MTTVFPPSRGPLLTREMLTAMRAARDAGLSHWQGSFDLGRSEETVEVLRECWRWRKAEFPWPAELKPRTIHYWDGGAFAPVQRFSESLIKLVPTTWGAPTFEIDGIKMLPSAQCSPWDDAQRKVALIEPRGKRILDTCGGLGYFARACVEAGASHVLSFEKNADVLWLRGLNPWSPDPHDPVTARVLELRHGDVAEALATLPAAGFDAVLHDPPRFGIAGELYAQRFYDELARVLRPRGALFHYTGAPNRNSRGRDLPAEVMRRLEKSGFSVQRALDGVQAIRLA